MQYARKVMEETYLQHLPDDDLQARSGMHAKSEELLAVANGDWRDFTKLQHFCKLGCCASREDSRNKFWNAICRTVLSSRPKTPAVSRWCKCSKTASWYMKLACTQCSFVRLSKLVLFLCVSFYSPLISKRHTII
jgi:hypothetical protein